MEDPTSPRPDITLDVVSRLHSEGLPSSGIAAALKCSKALVRRRLRQLNLQPNGRTYLRPDLEAIKAMNSQGLNDSQIASELGFSTTAICKARNKMGLKSTKFKAVGEVVSKNGYRAEYKGPDNYVYEHRLVAERGLGRPLRHAEVVHHIDGSRDNNSSSNLAVFACNGDHMAHHNLIEREGVADSREECVKSGAISS